MSPGAWLLPAAARRAVAWKNGGGVTREVAAEPSGSDLASFDWRVSIAQVEAAGPFSIFPGIERRLAVLEGELELAIHARAPVRLTPKAPALVFSGEAAAFARPLGARVTDLNVMTRIGRCSAGLELRRAPAGALNAPAGTSLLIALSELAVRVDCEEMRLGRFDALRLEAGVSLGLAAPQSEFWWIEIRPAGLRNPGPA